MTEPHSDDPASTPHRPLPYAEPRGNLGHRGTGPEAEEREGAVAGRRGLRDGRVGCEGEQQAGEASARSVSPVHGRHPQ